MAKAPARKNDSAANLGFEAKLWLAADKLRNNMDAAEYKHVVLGLIFLKYISDTFEEQRTKLVAGQGDYEGANPEDPDEYRAENVFWVPKEGRWSHLQANAKQPSIGKVVDDAMVAIERDNPRLKGVLPKDYARPALDKHRLGELIDLIGGIELADRAPSPLPSPSGRWSEDQIISPLPLGEGPGARVARMTDRTPFYSLMRAISTGRWTVRTANGHPRRLASSPTSSASIAAKPSTSLSAATKQRQRLRRFLVGTPLRGVRGRLGQPSLPIAMCPVSAKPPA
jgi:hypothetical protein